MRKLFLTSFTGKSEKGTFEQTRLVALNVNHGDDDRQNTLNANKLVQRWFKCEYPNCELDAIGTFEAISEDYFKAKPVDEYITIVTPDLMYWKSLAEELKKELLELRKEQSKKIIDVGKRFYSINDITGLEEEVGKYGPEGYTKDVLIDLDGNKKNFRVGWQVIDDDSFERTWHLYGNIDDKIDMEHAVYTKLDF